MKTKLLLTLMVLGALFQANAQNVLPEMKSRPADFEYLSAPDSLGVRHPLLTPNVTNRNIEATQNLPYPIIFIHGLNSNELVWGNADPTANTINNTLQSYGLTFGGRFDFNLNNDNSNYTSNILFYSLNSPQADIVQWPSTLVNGDYYFINFDVGINGSVHPYGVWPFNTDVLSNEAAIAKQGVALTSAIQKVLELTSRDKVILFGHSMGGLAAREYLQNPENWVEPNINHHVAKLITTGTPHGGYTGTNAGLVTGIDSQSEAYRDLRKEYSNNNQGIYLFGGAESTITIGNSYYNNDINCNGINNDGSYIQGLNEKYLPIENVDFAYIMGNCDGCVVTQGTIPGDGVVRLVNANLSSIYPNLLPTPLNEFIYTGSAVSQIHSDLPMINTVNMQALDEPNFYNLGYGLEFGKTYKGFIYNQPVGGYTDDYDDYKFTISGNNDFNILINNITSPLLSVSIFDANVNLLAGPFSGNSSSPINLNGTLPNGNYYMEIYATPGTLATIYPYNFRLTNQLSIATVDSKYPLNLFPNPTTSAVFFDNAKLGFTEVQVFNYLGQEVAREELSGAVANQEINLSTLSAGVYVLKFHNGTSTATAKVVKQ